jgi:alpha-glucosidase
MEYAFPGEGFATCRDQFMLGEKYMVAPVVTPGHARPVQFPRGKWRDDRGKVYRGGKTETIEVPLDCLLYFEKL